jgi:hypothetical protein
LKIYNFYLCIFFICPSNNNFVYKILYIMYVFMKLYDRNIDLWINATNITSEEQMIKTKVVDLEKLYNFLVENL